MLGKEQWRKQRCLRHGAKVKNLQIDNTSKDTGLREELDLLTEGWGKSGENCGRKSHWIGVLQVA